LLDVGASTGGFTDCSCSAAPRKCGPSMSAMARSTGSCVVTRVVVQEGVNARYLTRRTSAEVRLWYATLASYPHATDSRSGALPAGTAGWYCW
jgi:predicted rRNA methylase YqxC with S4 and FtsJ domains